MQEIDRRTVRQFGVPEIVLMENAGRQVFAFLRRTYGDLPSRRLLIMCGKGNNGGDAFVAARHLRNRGIPFEAILFGRGPEVRGSAAVNLRALRRLGVTPREIRTLPEWRAARPLLRGCDLVLDGVLGTGLSRPVEGLLARVFEEVNRTGREVVAVDIPSGLSGDTADVPGPCIVATHTVALARPKIPHIFPPAAELCGKLHVADISIPDAAVAAQKPELELLEAVRLLPCLPPRRRDAHKGDFGHALVIAGSRGKGGAARLAALGALRAGCGLVTAAVPAGLQAGMVSRAMEAMTEGMPETPPGTLAASALPLLLQAARRKQAIAIGPGLTSHPETEKLIRALVPRLEVPVVLDADGINAFAGEAGSLSGRRRPLVLTPHPGEMARLLGMTTAEVQSDRVGLARAFARRHACCLVLKGHRSLIATPGGRVLVNPTGNPGMATGGSGDVLAGLLAGLLAQGIEAENAVKIGVYLHGLAGDLAAAEVGEMPLIARDILARFPAALARLQRARAGSGAGGEER